MESNWCHLKAKIQSFNFYEDTLSQSVLNVGETVLPNGGIVAQSGEGQRQRESFRLLVVWAICCATNQPQFKNYDLMKMKAQFWALCYTLLTLKPQESLRGNPSFTSSRFLGFSLVRNDECKLDSCVISTLTVSAIHWLAILELIKV